MAVSQKSHRLVAGLAGSGVLNPQSRDRLAPYVFSKFDKTCAGSALSASAGAWATSSTPAPSTTAQIPRYIERHNICCSQLRLLVQLLYGNYRQILYGNYRQTPQEPTNRAGSESRQTGPARGPANPRPARAASRIQDRLRPFA